MPNQTNDPKRLCAECGQEMKFDGTQRFAKLGYEYDLHTCYTETPDKCKAFGFTFAGPKRPIKKGEA